MHLHNRRLERGFTRKRKLSLNEWQEDWVTFFSRQRLQLQLDMIEKDYGERETRELWSRLQVMQLVCQHLQMQFLKDVGIRDMFVLPVMNEFVQTHREVSLFIEVRFPCLFHSIGRLFARSCSAQRSPTEIFFTVTLPSLGFGD
uniref:Uncharacterized protein LOC116938191 isoform X1 n=1 Tax=Petromyzon marinus TaxID=7757 RepID=A0AAJ7SKY4_PETMA|nr:uncharacterized protein LOC116938191 isoform X1 [Petromyzon marinus]